MSGKKHAAVFAGGYSASNSSTTQLNYNAVELQRSPGRPGTQNGYTLNGGVKYHVMHQTGARDTKVHELSTWIDASSSSVFVSGSEIQAAFRTGASRRTPGR